MHMERSTLRRGLWIGLGIALPVAALGTIAACGSNGGSGPPALGEGSDAGMDVQMMHEAAPPMEAAPPPADAYMCTDGAAGFSISPMSLTFSAGDGGAGLVPCGTSAPSQPLALTNNTCGPVTFNATLTNGANAQTAYTITPQMGMIPAGQTQLVEVQPLAIPATGASVATDYYGASLTISATVGGITQSYPSVSLHQTAQGVILGLQPAGMNSYSFGDVSLGASGNVQLGIINSGNLPVQLGLSTGTSVFTVADVTDGGTSSPPLNIPPGMERGAEITFTPTMVQPYTDALVFQVPPGTPLCAAPLMPLTLTGNGKTGIAVSPGTVPFGAVQCNQPAAAPQPVTISNTGNATTFTVQLAGASSSPYILKDSTGATLTQLMPYPLPSASNVVVSVVPKAITSPASTMNGAFNDTLTIMTQAPMDQPHLVNLQETAQGAILTLQPASINMSVAATQTTTAGFTVGNTGNYPVGFTVTPSPGSTFSVNQSSGMLAGGTNTSNAQLIAIGPAKGTQVTGTLTLTPNAGSILCQDVPPPMPLSITGQ